MIILTFLFVASSIIYKGCEVNFDELAINEWDKVIDLEGRWKFSIGDDSLWANPKYDDDGWEGVIAPSSWENEGYHGYNGYAWYRKHFNVRSKYKNQTLNLHLGTIDDVDEVYINGNLIGFSGSFPPHYETPRKNVRKTSQKPITPERPRLNIDTTSDRPRRIIIDSTCAIQQPIVKLTA